MKHTGDFPPETGMRPYERCLAAGPESLTDAQLLAVILRTGRPGISAEALSEEILSLHGGSLEGICHLTQPELERIPGVGAVKAIQIRCIAELSKRIAASGASRLLSFTNPESIAAYYMEQLRHEEVEHLILMMFDTRHRLIAEKRMFRGTVNRSVVSARELFLCALDHRAVFVILVHNHPGGDPSPSGADVALTEKVGECGRMLDIRLSDHIIIGDRRYFSFREEGYLPPEDG